jgi:DNA (cytosine-5)-methyltransferase 1
MGYHRAGFDIVGVDIKPQPHYPFEFHQADAMTFFRRGTIKNSDRPFIVRGVGSFDAIHASPPCQAYTLAARRWDVERADLAELTQRMLRWVGRPYVIENVPGAGRHIGGNLLLCGQMFALPLVRHRVFAVEPPILFAPHHPPCQGLVRAGKASTVAGHGGDNVKGMGGRAQKQAAMGIDWMTDEELNEAIPPAYTEWVGRRLLAAIEAVA